MVQGSRRDIQGGVGRPKAGPGEIYLDTDLEGGWLVVAEVKSLEVVAGHEVRVRGVAGTNGRIQPGPTFAARLAPIARDHRRRRARGPRASRWSARCAR